MSQLTVTTLRNVYGRLRDRRRVVSVTPPVDYANAEAYYEAARRGPSLPWERAIIVSSEAQLPTVRPRPRPRPGPRAVATMNDAK